MAVLALGAGPAFAANCGRQIIDDWFKDGRVDKIYALHCYEDAIEQLPNDVRTYSDAPQANQARAAAGAREGRAGRHVADGDDPGRDDADRGDPGRPDHDRPRRRRRRPTRHRPRPAPTVAEARPGGEALDDSSSASSVPIPLLVLAGLALLLLAAGGAGYLNRRMQARRIDGGPDDPAPPTDL